MISKELQEILDKKDIKKMFKDVSQGKFPDPECYFKRREDEETIYITSVDRYLADYYVKRQE